MTSIIKKVLAPYVPIADELEENMQYIIDGTLLPCWSWAARPELYSGKHKTTGMNIQVACNLAGRLAWISDPVAAAATTAIAWMNQESSSRWTPVTGLAIKDMSAMA